MMFILLFIDYIYTLIIWWFKAWTQKEDRVLPGVRFHFQSYISQSWLSDMRKLAFIYWILGPCLGAPYVQKYDLDYTIILKLINAFNGFQELDWPYPRLKDPTKAWKLRL